MKNADRIDTKKLLGYRLHAESRVSAATRSATSAKVGEKLPLSDET